MGHKAVLNIHSKSSTNNMFLGMCVCMSACVYTCLKYIIKVWDVTTNQSLSTGLESISP